MKRKAYDIMPYLFFGSLFLWLAMPLAQAQQPQGSVRVDSIQISRARDSVRIAFRVSLDSLEVRSNRSVVLQPFFKGEGGDRWLPAIEVMGRKRYLYYLRNDSLTYAGAPCRVVKRDKAVAQRLDYQTALAYEPWMEGASLYLGEDQCGCGQVISRAQRPLAVADIAWHPALAYIAPQVETVKSRRLSGQAYLDFPVNKTDIYPDYRRNPAELAKIRATIDSVQGDADVRIVQMQVKGYASPEGTYRSNARLAQGRTEALKAYIIGRYGLADNLFVVAYEPENWEGLRAYVAQIGRAHV